MVKIVESTDNGAVKIVVNTMRGKKTYYTTEAEIEDLRQEKDYIWVTDDIKDIVNGKLKYGNTVHIREIDSNWLKQNGVPDANASWREKI